MSLLNNPLYTAALSCWSETDAHSKAKQTLALDLILGEPGAGSDFSRRLRPALDDPGRPSMPTLVDPRKLPRRGLGSVEGHAAFIHAICHIEFSAINLALDAALRFAGMPAEYYREWLEVAVDEARHFSLLAAHLGKLGYNYGDFVAHNGLWAVANQTSDDILARMALIPRVLEARGLDVTPAMIDRLHQHGDDEGAEILAIILDDEIRHVAVGSRWFLYLSRARGLDAAQTFQQLVSRELGPRATAALNIDARRAAGFSEAELDWLSGNGEDTR